MSKVALRILNNADLDYQSVKLLKDWRIKNRFAYLGDYKITHASVKKWLKESVLDNPDRFLFWVVVNGERVGHIGVKSLKRNSVEIDNVSRGIDKYKGAMSQALQYLVCAYLGYRIWLRVLPDNIHAIKFYERNGFEVIGKVGEFLKMEYEN